MPSGRRALIRVRDSSPFDQRLQPPGESAVEFHRFARERVAKFQLARMQRKPPRGIGSRAVFAVADDRMAEGGQLNADLVLASGFERYLKQRFVPACANYVVMRDCQLATSIDAMNHV